MILRTRENARACGWLGQLAVGLLVMGMALTLSGCWPCRDCPKCTDSTEHDRLIIAGCEDCRVVSVDKNDIEPGHNVVWTNHTDADVTLDFSKVPELFGTRTEVIRANGGVLTLRVLDDAVKKGEDSKEFEYVLDCGPEYIPYGPPKIVVCPPGGCG